MIKNATQSLRRNLYLIVFIIRTKNVLSVRTTFIYLTTAAIEVLWITVYSMIMLLSVEDANLAMG